MRGMQPPPIVKIICDNCGVVVDIPTDSLATLSVYVVYQGICCPQCGNVLIFDNLVLRMLTPPAQHATKRKVVKKKGWRIVNKGKLKTDAPRARRSSANRKIKKSIQR